MRMFPFQTIFTRFGTLFLITFSIILLIKYQTILVTVNARQEASSGGGGDTSFLTSIHQHFSSEENNDRSSSQNGLLLPEQTWNNFIQLHSNEALTLNPHNRSFVIGYYSCPHQIGNRFHDYFNSAIVAIITNRTLVSKYYDKKTCYLAHVGYGQSVCKMTGTLDGCNHYLDATGVIPVFEEWQRPLDFPLIKDLGPRNPDYEIGSRRFRGWNPTSKFKSQHRNKSDSELADLSEEIRHPHYAHRFNRAILQTSREWLMDEMQTKEDFFHGLEPQIHNHPEWQQRLDDLFSEGPWYLYGMLREKLFSLRPEFHPTEIKYNEISGQSKSHRSLAIHLRHKKEKDDGSKLSSMVHNCLDEVIQYFESQEPNTRFSAFIMSDREKSIIALSEELTRRNVKVFTAAHSKESQEQASDPSNRREHGKLAGVGYVEDLYFVSQARDAVIGNCRLSSASQLLIEGVVYNAKTNKNNKNHGSKKDPFICCLDRNANLHKKHTVIEPRGIEQRQKILDSYYSK